MSLPEGAMSYSARLRQLAEERGDETALIYMPTEGDDLMCSWRYFAERSVQVANALARDGVGYGDRVGIQIRTSPEHIVVALAAYHLGAVPVPVRWDLPEWELARVMTVVDPKVVVGLEHSCITATAHDLVDWPQDVVSPNASGILSSGSTGSPKVILRIAPGMYFPGASSNRLMEAYGD